MIEKPRVLFVCVHNAARSQMAEALLRKHAGDRFEVASAGFEPTEVHPLTRTVLAEVGIDPSTLYPKGVREFLAKVAVRHAIIVCAQAEAQCPKMYPFAGETLYWAFDDPAALEGSTELQLVKFRRVRDEIDARIRGWLRNREGTTGLEAYVGSKSGTIVDSESFDPRLRQRLAGSAQTLPELIRMDAVDANAAWRKSLMALASLA